MYGYCYDTLCLYFSLFYACSISLLDTCVVMISMKLHPRDSAFGEVLQIGIQSQGYRELGGLT